MARSTSCATSWLPNLFFARIHPILRRNSSSCAEWTYPPGNQKTYSTKNKEEHLQKVPAGMGSVSFQEGTWINKQDVQAKKWDGIWSQLHGSVDLWLKSWNEKHQIFMGTPQNWRRFYSHVILGPVTVAFWVPATKKGYPHIAVVLISATFQHLHNSDSCFHPEKIPNLAG